LTVSLGKFNLDGEVAPVLTLQTGNTYVFDQSDSTNSTHPFVLQAGGTPISGPITEGVAGNSGATVMFTVGNIHPDEYVCGNNHLGMGSIVSVIP